MLYKFPLFLLHPATSCFHLLSFATVSYLAQLPFLFCSMLPPLHHFTSFGSFLHNSATTLTSLGHFDPKWPPRSAKLGQFWGRLTPNLLILAIFELHIAKMSQTCIFWQIIGGDGKIERRSFHRVLRIQFYCILHARLSDLTFFWRSLFL